MENDCRTVGAGQQQTEWAQTTTAWSALVSFTNPLAFKCHGLHLFSVSGSLSLAVLLVLVIWYGK